MLGNVGFTEILLIAVIGLILFGPKKLPEIGRTAGRMVREFRQAAQGLMDTGSEPERKEATRPEAKLRSGRLSD
ncbi:twin-arginine translocase TatA/TatE family subunit [Paenibacillus abyssi]|uniref:Sec-independent protein translocase protein TatA n=1 Tax=Paenibacillus abyssi TaxID=1340531 RepID=A0A917G0Q4_9BACL|nr:twin-arginine translocase TatA/TatE family subunit [Paenibacillus abyssi]GGG16985.1 Sec-independent protein translocase protein TatA [Paenibacillus abyssi]